VTASVAAPMQHEAVAAAAAGGNKFGRGDHRPGVGRAPRPKRGAREFRTFDAGTFVYLASVASVFNKWASLVLRVALLQQCCLRVFGARSNLKEKPRKAEKNSSNIDPLGFTLSGHVEGGNRSQRVSTRALQVHDFSCSSSKWIMEVRRRRRRRRGSK